MHLPHQVRCGLSGWSHPDWSNLVFPQVRPRGFHPLAYLAGYYNLFEIDASRDGVPRPELSRLWLQKAPGAMFSVVLPPRFTSGRDLAPEAVAAFKETLWPFHRTRRLVCVVMEFPWEFRFTKENRDHLLGVRRAFREFPLAAEMHHSSWMLDEALGTLMDHRIGFVNLDQPEWARTMPAASIVTSGIGYVRLHGRADAYLYGAVELDAWCARIRRIAAHTDAVYVVSANAQKGYSLVNALELRAQLGEPALAPCELERNFPQRLAGLAKPVRSIPERLRLCG